MLLLPFSSPVDLAALFRSRSALMLYPCSAGAKAFAHWGTERGESTPFPPPPFSARVLVSLPCVSAAWLVGWPFADEDARGGQHVPAGRVQGHSRAGRADQKGVGGESIDWCCCFSCTSLAIACVVLINAWASFAGDQGCAEASRLPQRCDSSFVLVLPPCTVSEPVSVSGLGCAGIVTDLFVDRSKLKGRSTSRVPQVRPFRRRPSRANLFGSLFALLSFAARCCKYWKITPLRRWWLCSKRPNRD
mgnify:CR=1 FL=1